MPTITTYNSQQQQNHVSEFNQPNLTNQAVSELCRKLKKPSSFKIQRIVFDGIVFDEDSIMQLKEALIINDVVTTIEFTNCDIKGSLELLKQALNAITTPSTEFVAAMLYASFADTNNKEIMSHMWALNRYKDLIKSHPRNSSLQKIVINNESYICIGSRLNQLFANVPDNIHNNAQAYVLLQRLYAEITFYQGHFQWQMTPHVPNAWQSAYVNIAINYLQHGFYHADQIPDKTPFEYMNMAKSAAMLGFIFSLLNDMQNKLYWYSKAYDLADQLPVTHQNHHDMLKYAYHVAESCSHYAVYRSTSITYLNFASFHYGEIKEKTPADEIYMTDIRELQKKKMTFFKFFHTQLTLSPQTDCYEEKILPNLFEPKRPGS